MRDNLAWQLVMVFGPLSLLSFGGGRSVIADIDTQVVSVHGWITQADFVDLYAITRALPGPGSLLSTLIGWRVDGIWGAIVASLAYFAPSSLIAYGTGKVWNYYRGNSWQGALERGLAPMATGLILAGAFAILQAASGSLSVWLIVAASATIFILKPKLSPLLVLFGAGLVSALAATLH